MTDSAKTIPHDLKVEIVSMDEINNVKPFGNIKSDDAFLFDCKVKTYKNILTRGAMPPILLDAGNNIFDGQCRYRAHKELGAKYILCMRLA